MSVNTVTVNNTGEELGELVFPAKETFKSKNNIASLDANGKLVLSQALYTAGDGIVIDNSGIISSTGGGSSAGWYATPEQLPSTGENGDYAIVGSTDTIWVWDSDKNKWVDSCKYVNPETLPTPITDTKTITTTLENLITDTQYANKPGTILINPNIKNTGAILVGEAITDISKAFPVYTDQPVNIVFKNINDFKVAGDIAGESFNYVISFVYVNQLDSTNA